MKKTLTVICPVHNEEETIPVFYERMRAVMDRLGSRYKPELLFVDNASTDRSLDAIARLRAQDPSVYVLAMSANVGYQRSIEGGLTHAKGDLFVMIDVDCEDPPELVPEFVEIHEQGYDIVYGERRDREEFVLIKSMRKLFYRLTHLIADDPFIIDMAEFCLLTDEVRRAILESQNSFPFVRASIGRVGFRRIGLPYKRQKRVRGKTHYNVFRMTKFAVAGILSATTLPLRLIAYLFLPTLLVLLVLAIASSANGAGSAQMLMGLIAFAYFGFALSALSIYLARTYKNGLMYPNHIVNRNRTHLQPDADPHGGGSPAEGPER